MIRKLRRRHDAACRHAASRRGDRTGVSGDWLGGELDRALRRATRIPGRTETFHRLNRTEYQNAIRDLLALDIDVADFLPADDASYGFDNMAGVLRLSQSLMERYLSAAKTIARLAVGAPPPAVGRDDLPDSAGLPAARSRRGPAVRHARRHAGHAPVPAGRRVRHQASNSPARQARAPSTSSKSRSTASRSSCSRSRRPRRAPRRGRRTRREASWNCALPVTGRPARGRRRVLPQAGRSRRAGARAVPESAHLRQRRRQRRFDADGHERHRHRPAQRDRAGRHAQPPADLRVPAGQRRRRKRRAPSASSRSWRDAPIAARASEDDVETLLAFYTEGRSKAAASTPASSSRSAGCWSIRTSCSASKPIAPAASARGQARTAATRSRGARRLSHQRSRAGVAAVVLPLEQHSRRRAARRGGAGQAAASRRCSSARCGGCSPIRGRRR